MLAMTRVSLSLRLLVVAVFAIVPAVQAQKTVSGPPMARTIILVRHGAYQADSANPSPGPRLLPVGVAQAKLAAARLAATGRFDAIFASPMTRAQETARVIAADVPHGSFETLPQLEECTPPTRRKEITRDETAEAMAACKATLDALFAHASSPQPALRAGSCSSPTAT